VNERGVDQHRPHEDAGSNGKTDEDRRPSIPASKVLAVGEETSPQRPPDVPPQ
jgi:hypothetical protein